MNSQGKSSFQKIAFKRVMWIPLSALLLAGCADGSVTRSEVGALTGAVVGGVVGNQFGNGNGRVLATMAGVVAGGIIGSDIGRTLDKRDREYASRTEYDALEYGRSGRPRRWSNPDSGHRGEIIPEPAYKIGRRQCRRYRHIVYIDGRPETMRGTACRRRDGSWANVG